MIQAAVVFCPGYSKIACAAGSSAYITGVNGGSYGHQIKSAAIAAATAYAFMAIGNATNGHVGIESDGYIKPSADGYVYLTPSVYNSGAVAQSQLALTYEPTGYFRIPANDVAPTLPPRSVEPNFGQPGGGIEVRAPNPVSVERATWGYIGP